MSLSTVRRAMMLLACTFLLTVSTGGAGPAPPALPNPVLFFIGQEPYEAGGKQWTRYKYEVFNRKEYPNELFAAAPELPPCGTNTKSSRTWVDLYDQAGKRLYGFCSLSGNDGLGRLWFALESNALPPSWIYVELNDRKTNTKYKSNLAETTD